MGLLTLGELAVEDGLQFIEPRFPVLVQNPAIGEVGQFIIFLGFFFGQITFDGVEAGQ